MLILSRKLSEDVLIGGIVTVKVIEIRRGLVKLGFDCPKEINIVRKELVDGSGQVNPANTKQGRSRG